MGWQVTPPGLTMTIIACLVVMQQSVYADAVQARRAFGCEAPIRVGFYEYGAFYHDGVGIDPDLIAEMSRRSGCDFITEVLPRDQVLEGVKAGSLDLATIVTWSPSRTGYSYLLPTFGWNNGIVTSPAIAAETGSLDAILDRSGLRFGVVRGSLYGPYYDYRLRNPSKAATIIPYADQGDLFTALKAGEVDAILSPTVGYAYYLAQADVRAFVMIEAPVASTSRNLMFGKSRFSVGQINAWTRLLEQMLLDGTLLKIGQAHLPADVAESILHYDVAR